MRANFIIDSEPPPVKSRKVGGVRNALYTVDLSATIRTVEMCREHKMGSAEHMRWEKLKINAFLWVFPQTFK
jgi:hypothetical protein